MACSLLGCYIFSLSSTSLTMLVLVLSAFPFILYKIKQLRGAVPVKDNDPEERKIGSEILKEEHELVEEEEEEEEEERELQIEELIISPSASTLLKNDGVLSDSTAFDEGSSPENLWYLTQSSGGSISGEELDVDDSLIEMLPDGHFIVSERPNALLRRGQSGGLWPETGEEENLIEIDIAVGSIKCSRFEIKT